MADVITSPLKKSLQRQSRISGFRINEIIIFFNSDGESRIKIYFSIFFLVNDDVDQNNGKNHSFLCRYRALTRMKALKHLHWWLAGTNLPFALPALWQSFFAVRALMGLFVVKLHDKNHKCFVSRLLLLIHLITSFSLPHLAPFNSGFAVDSLPCRAPTVTYYRATKCWNTLPSVIIWNLCQFHVLKKQEQWI